MVRRFCHPQSPKKCNGCLFRGVPSMFQRKSLVAVCAVGALTWPRSAAAQASSAGALFDQGVAYMEENRFDRACPAIEVSYWLDARPGTLFTLAECEAERGRLAMAVARYDE